MTLNDEERARTLLEFETVRDELKSLAMGPAGQERIAGQGIDAEADRIRRFHDGVEAWRTIIAESPTLPGWDFPPVREELDRIGKAGYVAEAGELAAIAAFADSAARMRRFLLRSLGSPKAPPQQVLSSAATALPDLSPLAGDILDVIGRDGALREERIPELRALRRSMVAIRREIEELAARWINDDRSLWQTDVPTDRDGRTVLPLKSDYRGKVDGIVHDVSPTGATLFIEPFDLVRKNNDLVDAANQYRQAVATLLRKLTESARSSIEPLHWLLEGVADLDALYARARYALVHRCARAVIAGHGLKLIAARHPLLAERAVPIHLELASSVGILVVTGPNTGGKTVALKTVGLLALMNQFGMFIPAGEGSALPLFDAVFADIGDEQSIVGSLSTFSAHLRSIATILAGATRASLVLLDELGSGTDPNEGAALATAILDRLRTAAGLTVITTHNVSLKQYALTTPGALNASLSFDAASMSPTYRLVVGVPGESHALDIAAHSGIDPAIVEAARQRARAQDGELGAAIREFSNRQHDLAERLERLERSEAEFEGRLHDLRERESRADAKERERKSAELRELRQFLGECRKQLENLVRELRSGEVTREQTLRVKSFIANLDARVTEEERSLEHAQEPVETLGRSSARGGGTARAPRQPAPGVEVLLLPKRQRATIIRRAKAGQWIVAVNTVKMTVPEERIELAEPRDAERSVDFSAVDIGGPPPFVLDLRGLRLDEAMGRLEQQVERAVATGLGQFAVIHGLGEGILQRGVRDYLEQSPLVGTFQYSRPEEGGFGRTEVVLGTKPRPAGNLP